MRLSQLSRALAFSIKPRSRPLSVNRPPSPSTTTFSLPSRSSSFRSEYISESNLNNSLSSVPPSSLPTKGKGKAEASRLSRGSTSSRASSPPRPLHDLVTSSLDIKPIYNSNKKVTISGELRKPRKYWASLENQRKALDEVGAKIGVKGSDLSPWYNVNVDLLRKNGLNIRLHQSYEHSYYFMLKSVYPEHDWVPWKFKVLPKNLDRYPEIVERALGFIEAETGIERPEDWYELSTPTLRKLGVSAVITKLGGLFEVLRKYRPGFAWEEDKFIGVRMFGRKNLGASLKRLFPDMEIVENAELGPSVRVSYLIPLLKIAIEYQTIKDYGLEDRGGKVEVSLHEDKVKRYLAENLGLKLFFIPFWWDRSLGSLAATIGLKDPALMIHFGSVDTTEAKPVETLTTLSLSSFRRS